MIKIYKPITKYAVRVDFSAEMEFVIPGLQKDLNRDAIKSLKVPKNTLRIIFKNKDVGFDGDGFVRNFKTAIFYYNIITFKR